MRCAEVAPQLAAQLKLKWPNDLLLGGAKIAGILIEAETIGGRTTQSSSGSASTARTIPAAPPIRRPILRPTASR